jgi:hypothetical protein
VPGDLINVQFPILNSHPIGWELRIEHWSDPRFPLPKQVRDIRAFLRELRVSAFDLAF